MSIPIKYHLKIADFDNNPKLEISEAEYFELIEAKGFLSAALSIEEKYELVLGNFMDLEKELLSITMERVIDNSFDYNRAYTLNSTVNRRLVNFILGGKSYTELIHSMASKCVKNTAEVKKTISTLKSKHYDESLDYHLMEKLRNHVSHSGLAVHGVTGPDTWVRNEEGKAVSRVYNTDFYALRARFAENDRFEKKLLQKLPEKIDLKKAARSYMGAISNIQDSTRKLIADSITSARSTTIETLGKYAAINNGNSFPLGVFSSETNGHESEPIIIFLDWDDVRITLTKKNESISNIEKRHISNAITSK